MDRVLSNARIATMTEGYGMTDGGVAISDGRIVDVGPHVTGGEDMAGRLITPGLVDCHTHLVYGGNRAREFEMRLEGATYEQLARAGGGILSTVAATRAASEEELVASALPRLDALIAEGVTTVEIKSGYGLDIDTELRMLRAARRLADLRPVRVMTTFLGAHAVPPDTDADTYIDDVCLPALDAVAEQGLAHAVDAFCETIAFTPRQVRRVFDRAQSHGLRLKLHAEQLSNSGGTALAASYNALSADHLEYLDEEAVKLMRAHDVTAVLLPGAYYTLRETQAPPVTALRACGVTMAVASDCNPGSSPMASLLLAMNMVCTLFRMTPMEALRGATHAAAKALALDEVGRIQPGAHADLAIWDVADPAELSYRIGFNPLHRRIFGGAG